MGSRKTEERFLSKYGFDGRNQFQTCRRFRHEPADPASFSLS